MPVVIPQMKWDEWVRSIQIALPNYLQRLSRQVNNLSDGKFEAVNFVASSIPTTGAAAKGDICRKINPTVVTTSNESYILYGWICTVEGNPGTWEELRFLVSDLNITTGGYQIPPYVEITLSTIAITGDSYLITGNSVTVTLPNPAYVGDWVNITVAPGVTGAEVNPDGEYLQDTLSNLQLDAGKGVRLMYVSVASITAGWYIVLGG
jgi:hypothetical protein